MASIVRYVRLSGIYWRHAASLRPYSESTEQAGGILKKVDDKTGVEVVKPDELVSGSCPHQFLSACTGSTCMLMWELCCTIALDNKQLNSLNDWATFVSSRVFSPLPLAFGADIHVISHCLCICRSRLVTSVVFLVSSWRGWHASLCQLEMPCSLAHITPIIGNWSLRHRKDGRILSWDGPQGTHSKTNSNFDSKLRHNL